MRSSSASEEIRPMSWLARCLGTPALAAASTMLLPLPAPAGDTAPMPVSTAAARLQEYVRIDTSNPPGNEAAGVAFLARVLREAGIEPHVHESAPGRANLWARLEGGPGRALVLLHHVDVVPADRRYWQSDPFGGEIRDGYVHGRGAIDSKGLGIAQLQAFLELHRSGSALRRPVILLATADEEAGGRAGLGWLLERHAAIFADVEWVLTEGGRAQRIGDRTLVSIEVTQKIPLWLRLIARGDPGHGSVPRAETAVTRLVRALVRIAEVEFDSRVTPAVDRYAKARAAAGLQGDRAELRDLRAAVADETSRRALRAADPALSALTEDTCAITRLSASDKINVIPSEAWAEVDCRLLPDRPPADFLAALQALIDDPGIEIRELLHFEPGESSIENELYRAIVAAAGRDLRGAVVVPAVAGAFTDSHYFRERGIVAYGYSPFILAPEDLVRVHGNDERFSVAELEAGTRRYTDLLRRLVVR
jgi:acetylornithine deacetylase/succinyl-diaminopimelate desuccinylase-like protein